MTQKEFIEANKAEIDEYILRFEPELKLTDEIRTDYLQSDYGLRMWAIENEVDGINP